MGVFLKKRIAALLFAVMLCSACNGESVSSSVHTVPPYSETSAVTTTLSDNSETEESTDGEVSSATETTTVSESLPESSSVTTSVSSSEEISSDTQTTVSETTVSVTTTEAETTLTTTTSAAATTTVSKTEIIAETSIPEAKNPPAKIKISPVSSPGKLTESAGAATVDYSNASCGYISASYSGKSAKAKLRIASGGVTCDHDLAVTGETEYFPLMQGSGDYRIQIYEQLDGKLYSCALDLSVKLTVSDEVEMYLHPNSYSMFDKNSACVKKASEICADAEDDIEKIAAIFGYITDNVTYDYDMAATVQSGYIPDPDTVLSRKKGICFDYASLFAAMCRSMGIPTRLVIGYAEKDIYHAWNEVYTEETGWITPELLLDEKGYNIVDATFYASAKDKEYIAGYISDNGNYASVYRY
ncbi:MAG: transglutaminase domain-containing protein [Oscillospiraceae bacterium]|nr:transglutaminase domain-containing protein [Oscillospiraceae bacterium]